MARKSERWKRSPPAERRGGNGDRVNRLLVKRGRQSGVQPGPCGPLVDFHLSFAYAGVVSSTCRVSFTEGADVTHTVTVSASSLYEAAILGIAEFKKSGFSFGGINGGTMIKIAVEPPAITYELTVAKVQSWLETNGKTPREQAKKVTLRQVLSRA